MFRHEKLPVVALTTAHFSIIYPKNHVSCFILPLSFLGCCSVWTKWFISSFKCSHILNHIQKLIYILYAPSLFIFSFSFFWLREKGKVLTTYLLLLMETVTVILRTTFEQEITLLHSFVVRAFFLWLYILLTNLKNKQILLEKAEEETFLELTLTNLWSEKVTLSFWRDEKLKKVDHFPSKRRASERQWKLVLSCSYEGSFATNEIIFYQTMSENGPFVIAFKFKILIFQNSGNLVRKISSWLGPVWAKSYCFVFIRYVLGRPVHGSWSPSRNLSPPRTVEKWSVFGE